MGNKRKRIAKEALFGVAEPLQKRVKSDANPTAMSKASQQKSAKAKLLADRRPFAQDLKPEDHERERALYKLLSSEDFEDRIKAGDVIISSLLGGDAVGEPVLKRHLERRLFRGLASGSDAARVGFSYVLVEIIGQLVGEKDLSASKFPSLTFDSLVSMLVVKTTPVGKIPGQEERDHYWGRLFGLRSFVQAGVVLKEKARWKTTLELLIQLGHKKAWLRPQCGFVIAQAVPNLKRKLAESTLEEVVKANLAKSPEGLGIWLVVKSSFPEMKLPKPWQDPLGTKNLQDVASVLKGSTQEMSEESNQKLKQVNTTAQLHWVWDIILANFIKQDTSREFKVFWERVVDQSFFSKNATDSQKASGFKVFHKVLEACHSRADVIQSIFSEHLIGCLMNQASVEGRNLNRAALKTLKVIESGIEQHPELLLPVLTNLLGSNGAFNFDERTNTKTIERLLRFTRPNDALAVLETLEATVKGKAASEDSEKRLRIYAEYVSKLASVGADAKESIGDDSGSVGGLALMELAKLAYSMPEDGLTDQTKSVLRGRLSSSFAKVIRRPEDFPYLCDAILAIDPKAIEMDEEIQAELIDALERLQELVKPHKGSSQRQMPRQGLALLHAIAILQLYNEEPDALDVLSDTKVCYENLKQKKKTSDDAGMSELLVEILLSMVAQPSSLMRQTSLLVFEAFSPSMSAKALELLTDPLAVEENANGHKALFSTGDDEMDVDGDEGDDEGAGSYVDADEEGLSDLGSDVEFVGLANAEEAGDDGSEEDSEDEDEEADGDGVKGNDFDDGLAKILGTHRLDKDVDAASSDDDSDMTDSDMMALDLKMSEYFKHRVKGNNKRKQNRDAKESVINFKHRVLDLLSVYLKKEAPTGNPLVFNLFVPLLQHIRTTSAKALSSKACGIILDFSKHKKKAAKGAVASAANTAQASDVDNLVSQLEEIHKEASMDPSHAFARAVSSASLAVANVLFALDKRNYGRLAGVYTQTQQAWVMGKARIQTSFFVDWINWCQSHAQIQAQARLTQAAANGLDTAEAGGKEMNA